MNRGDTGQGNLWKVDAHITGWVTKLKDGKTFTTLCHKEFGPERSRLS